MLRENGKGIENMNGIKVDYAKNEIIVNKTFYRKAMKYGTPQSIALNQLMTLNSNFTVIVKSVKCDNEKKTYQGLTYGFMRDYINSYEPESTRQMVLDNLGQLITIAKVHENGFGYSKVKSWFLELYPEIKDFGCENFSKAGIEEIEKERATALAEKETPAAIDNIVQIESKDSEKQAA